MGPSSFSPRLMRSCLRKTTSCDDADSAMYFDSTVESATNVWSSLPQAMADPHSMATYHVLDLHASPSPKEESCHMSSFVDRLPLKMSECCRVTKRYIP